YLVRHVSQLQCAGVALQVVQLAKRTPFVARRNVATLTPRSCRRRRCDDLEAVGARVAEYYPEDLRAPVPQARRQGGGSDQRGAGEPGTVVVRALPSAGGW